MKTINDLKDELSIQFGSIMQGMSADELNVILTFILTSFAYDFPQVNSRAYKLGGLTNYRLYIDSIDDNFQEIQMMIPMEKISPIASIFYKNVYAVDSLYVEVDEVYAIQLTSQYINQMSAYYVPKKPMIMSDETGDFILIDRDAAIMYLTERIIVPDNIKEYVYGILRPYAFYKFTDFIVNRQFANLMDVNQKVFDLIYGSISNDITSGDLESVTSVSLSGLSVSFNNKLGTYASTLSSLGSSFSNPTFIEELNKTRSRFLTKFKRKKNIFFNYIF